MTVEDAIVQGLCLEDFLLALDNAHFQFRVKTKDGHEFTGQYEGAVYTGRSQNYEADHMLYKPDENGEVPEEPTEDNFFDFQEKNLAELTIIYPK